MSHAIIDFILLALVLLYIFPIFVKSFCHYSEFHLGPWPFQNTNTDNYCYLCVLKDALELIWEAEAIARDSIDNVDKFEKLLEVQKKLEGYRGDSLIAPHRVSKYMHLLRNWRLCTHFSTTTSKFFWLDFNCCHLLQLKYIERHYIHIISFNYLH